MDTDEQLPTIEVSLIAGKEKLVKIRFNNKDHYMDLPTWKKYAKTGIVYVENESLMHKSLKDKTITKLI